MSEERSVTEDRGGRTFAVRGHLIGRDSEDLSTFHQGARRGQVQQVSIAGLRITVLFD